MTPEDDASARSRAPGRGRTVRRPDGACRAGDGAARAAATRARCSRSARPRAIRRRTTRASGRYGLRPATPDRSPSGRTRPRILVTNDDGIDSRGLLVLKQALDPIGDVVVVAPETNQSAVGHQKTFMRPLRVARRTLAGRQPRLVRGRLAHRRRQPRLPGLLRPSRFDLVASGINYGANLGDDVTYSGTCRAAMEAVINGCPAFAISQEFYQHPDFALAGPRRPTDRGQHPRARPGAGRAAQRQRARAAGGTHRAIEVTRMGQRIYQDQLIERLDPRGVPYYWIGGPAPTGEANEGTDFHAVVNGRIAVTPIQLDLTAERLLRRLRRLELGAAGHRARPVRPRGVPRPTLSGRAGVSLAGERQARGSACGCGAPGTPGPG